MGATQPGVKRWKTPAPIHQSQHPTGFHVRSPPHQHRTVISHSRTLPLHPPPALSPNGLVISLPPPPPPPHLQIPPYSKSTPPPTALSLPTQKPTKLFSTLSCSSSSSPITTSDSISTSTKGAPSPSSTSLDLLSHLLSSRNYRLADDETRRLLIALAGDAAVKRGYVFFSEVQFIAVDNLRAIDGLWLEHSGGRFGYSVQRRLWVKQRRDFTRFFVKVGWMKKLDSEVEQYSYRSFPDEFMWEPDDKAPEGHLPLTNALRGTQLLVSVLTHPAFAVEGEEEMDEAAQASAANPLGSGKPMKLMGALKSDYSF